MRYRHTAAAFVPDPVAASHPVTVRGGSAEIGDDTRENPGALIPHHFDFANNHSWNGSGSAAFVQVIEQNAQRRTAAQFDELSRIISHAGIRAFA